MTTIINQSYIMRSMTYTYIPQVPSPDRGQVNATTQCVANCPQGKGTAADNKAYGDCVQNCIDNHYFVSSKGTPQATGAGNNAQNSGTDTAAAPTGTDSSSTGTETGAAQTGSSASKSSNPSSSKTGSAAAQSSTHNAAPAIIASGGAFVGVIAALLAM
jgi:hypothetical protein